MSFLKTQHLCIKSNKYNDLFNSNNSHNPTWKQIQQIQSRKHTGSFYNSTLQHHHQDRRAAKKNYTTEDRRAGTTWGKSLQPDNNLNRCSCNQNPPFEDPDEARVGRRGQVNYGEQLVNINWQQWNTGSLLGTTGIQVVHLSHLLERALEILLQQGLVRMASSWGRIASTRASWRWPCHGGKKCEGGNAV